MRFDLDDMTTDPTLKRKRKGDNNNLKDLPKILII